MWRKMGVLIFSVPDPTSHIRLRLLSSHFTLGSVDINIKSVCKNVFNFPCARSPFFYEPFSYKRPSAGQSANDFFRLLKRVVCLQFRVCISQCYMIFNLRHLKQTASVMREFSASRHFFKTNVTQSVAEFILYSQKT